MIERYAHANGAHINWQDRLQDRLNIAPGSTKPSFRWARYTETTQLQRDLQADHLQPVDLLVAERDLNLDQR